MSKGTAQVSRRQFLGTSAAGAGGVLIVSRHVLGGSGYVAPSGRITLANIGMGTQGFRELGSLLNHPEIQIIAVCDPNRDSNDYIEWGKNGIRNTIRSYLGQPRWRENDSGCPGGREVGREVVDGFYTNQRKGAAYKACRAYADFRELLDREKDLDVVKIMTPDHLHAAIAIAAMNRGKHVLTHKPLANRLHEGRLVVETARKTKVKTHLLAHGSGGGNALIAQQVKEGVIGTLREIHNWTNRPVWPQYTEIPRDTPPVPKGFDWDLWLGPALDRPYHPHYTHTVFRGWYDFGGGSMADMGIYSLWPVFTTLGLGVPISAEAWASHTCTIVDHLSRVAVNDFSYPAACTLCFKVAPENMPALELFWYDGGMRPRLPEVIRTHNVEMAREGILFVGDQGAILAGFNGQSPQLFARGKREPLFKEEKPARRLGRVISWLEAIKEGTESPGSFLNAGPITDTVNLGTVALRAGRKVIFDSRTMTVTNVAAANRLLRRDYRKGWEL
jgi:predicted dehydrogenase